MAFKISVSEDNIWRQRPDESITCDWNIRKTGRGLKIEAVEARPGQGEELDDDRHLGTD